MFLVGCCLVGLFVLVMSLLFVLCVVWLLVSCLVLFLWVLHCWLVIRVWCFGVGCGWWVLLLFCCFVID